MKKGKAIHHSTVTIRVESYTTAYFCSLAGFMFVRGPGLGIRSLAFQFWERKSAKTNRSWLHFCYEQQERFAHGRSLN